MKQREIPGEAPETPEEERERLLALINIYQDAITSSEKNIEDYQRLLGGVKISEQDRQDYVQKMEFNQKNIEERKKDIERCQESLNKLEQKREAA